MSIVTHGKTSTTRRSRIALNKLSWYMNKLSWYMESLSDLRSSH